MGKVDKEWLALMLPNELDCFLRISLCELRLVWLRFDDLVVIVKRQRRHSVSTRQHVIAIGESKKPVKALPQRHKLWMVS